MSIYNQSGTALPDGYDLYGKKLQNAYDINGAEVFTKSSGRRVTFEDDFNGTALDTTKWGYELGDVRSNELQTYRAENNVSVSDSCLIITAKKEDFGTKHWTSGSITGQDRFEQTYGRWEAKVKFPNNAGAFGAFWLLGANMENVYHEVGDNDVSGVVWPKCGEIDITEQIPWNATQAKANLWKYTGGSIGTGSSGTININDWNIYACEWTPDYIAMFVNDTEYKRWTFSDYSASAVQAYHLPFYMILNLAVGGSGGTPDASATEMKMYVDWVRVYEPLNLE